MYTHIGQLGQQPPQGLPHQPRRTGGPPQQMSGPLADTTGFVTWSISRSTIWKMGPSPGRFELLKGCVELSISNGPVI